MLNWLKNRGAGQKLDRGSYVLLLATFIAAGCALVYELLISTVSSFLIGDTIRQFSITIGLFLTAMGLGSWVTRIIYRDLIEIFISVEVVLGIIGGLSISILFWVYGSAANEFSFAAMLFILVIGILIGLELPLVTRIITERDSLRTTLANALSFDYLGGLAGSLIFPLILLPQIGLIRTGLLMGILNETIALATLVTFRRKIRFSIWAIASLICSFVALVTLFLVSNPLSATLEQRLFRDPIIISVQSPYQQITVTKWHNDVRLFLDGHLQFSSRDAYRYHEALVIPAMEALGDAHRVLIIGGGDGLAAHEVLKYSSVQSVTLVDLDPAVTTLFSRQPLLVALNHAALLNPRVHVKNLDGFTYLQHSRGVYDLVIADLPDPRTASLQKLYTEEFDRLVYRHLASSGLFVTQATSPYYTPHAFWCIVATVRTVWPDVEPYHLDVPSFGDWGFVIAGGKPIHWSGLRLQVPTRFLTTQRVVTLPVFGRDILRKARGIQPDTLMMPRLLTYYDEDWARFSR